MTAGDLGSALSGVQAIVLDVDDTILDTRAAMVAAGTVALAAIWPGDHDHVAMAQRYYDDPGGWFRRFAAGTLAIEAMRTARLEDVAHAFGVTLHREGHDQYLEAYTPTFRRSQRLFDDVPGLLAAAESASIPVALLTNSTDRDTSIKLEVLGFAERFAAVVTTDTLGFGKPDARVYLEACRRVGIASDVTVCIGDSLEWDVLGAQQAGLRGIWLDRTGAVDAMEAPDVVRVTTLDEVTAALVANGPSRFGAGAVDR